jgi:hypothetical protein
MKKKVKITISLGGLVSSHSFGAIDHLVDAAASLSNETVLPPVEAPQGLHAYEPREPFPDPWHTEMINSGLDDKQTILLDYFYLSVFALGGNSADDFACNHWMIDSECTDHLSPYLDDFAHLDNTVHYAVVANGQKVPLHGPGKIIVH